MAEAQANRKVRFSCAVCGPKTLRAKPWPQPDGRVLCGRCRHQVVVRGTVEHKRYQRDQHRRWRSKVGGKKVVWVAFGIDDVLGVFSSEEAALKLSTVVRRYRVNQVPSERERELRKGATR